MTRHSLALVISAALIAACTAGPSATRLTESPAQTPSPAVISTPTQTSTAAPTTKPTSSATAQPTSAGIIWPAGLTAHPAGSSGNGVGYLEYLPADYHEDDSLRPLLVFVHDTAASGDGSEADLQNVLIEGIPHMVAAGSWPAEQPFVVLMPQMPEDLANAHCDFGAGLDAFLTYARGAYRIDPARMYLTGISCGGIAIWDYLSRARGNDLAAVAPIASAPYPWVTYDTCGTAQTPNWTFHGALDDLIPVHYIEDAFAELRGCTDPPPTDLNLTIYPDVSHDSSDGWAGTYDGSAGNDILEWMLGHSADLTPEPTAIPATPRPTPNAAARDVIIDTDMAVDDWLAILFLLGRREVDVRAITVTGTGEAHCAPGVQNALALLNLAGAPEIPVACGRETPLEGEHTFPEPWRERVDSLLGIDLPLPDVPDAGSAPDLLRATLSESTDDVAILTLGPLTNIADLLEESPEVAEKIDDVVVMGGAVEVGGNVGNSGVDIDNEFAEWNIYVDPLAAKMVLDSGVPVTLVPLDATNDAPMTVEFVVRMTGDATTPVAQFVADVTSRQRPLLEFGYYFWDPLAAAVIIDESLTAMESVDLTVVTNEGPESGRVVPANDGVKARYATSADLERLEDLLIDTFNGRTN